MITRPVQVPPRAQPVLPVNTVVAPPPPIIVPTAITAQVIDSTPVLRVLTCPLRPDKIKPVIVTRAQQAMLAASPTSEPIAQLVFTALQVPKFQNQSVAVTTVECAFLANGAATNFRLQPRAQPATTAPTTRPTP